MTAGQSDAEVRGGGFDLIRAAYGIDGLDDHERAVMVLLAFMANDRGEAWPSIAYMVEKTGKGERTVQRAIVRLVAAGHLTQRRRRHDTAVYRVHPLAQSRPVCGTGVSGTPVSLTPVSEDVKTRPTDTLTAKNNQPKKATPSQDVREAKPAAIAIPDWIPSDAWNGWLAMRKAKKASPTTRAIELAIATLKRLADDGHPPGDVLDQSTLKSWLDLYPIKVNRNDQHHAANGGTSGEYRPGPVTRSLVAAYNSVDADKW